MLQYRSIFMIHITIICPPTNWGEKKINKEIAAQMKWSQFFDWLFLVAQQPYISICVNKTAKYLNCSQHEKQSTTWLTTSKREENYKKKGTIKSFQFYEWCHVKYDPLLAVLLNEIITNQYFFQSYLFALACGACFKVRSNLKKTRTCTQVVRN